MKTLAAITFAAATALATLPALAEGPARGGPGGHASHAAMLSQDDRAALVDARIAAIRAGLKLSEAQDALFEPVAVALHGMNDMRESMRADMRQTRGETGGEMREAMQDMSRQEREEMRQEMRQDRQAMQDRDFMQRLEHRAETASAHGAVMADLAQAMRPFWDALDADQQRLLPILMQSNMAMQGRMQGGMRGDRMRGGEHGDRDARMHGRGTRD